MKSLFILSLPRSLSSAVHQLCCDALGLQSPGWTSAGEIMNLDRSVLFLGRGGIGHKYITPRLSSLFHPAKEYLGQVVAPQNFAYKDVTQPFVVSDWLVGNSNVAVLKIVPNIAHVAYAMMRRNWLYPLVAAGECRDGVQQSMVAGLLHAEKALDRVPGESVRYDDLIFDFEPLRQALRRLYPGQTIGPIDPGADFAAARAEILLRRKLTDYQKLERLEQELRGSADHTPSRPPARRPVTAGYAATAMR